MQRKRRASHLTASHKSTAQFHWRTIIASTWWKCGSIAPRQRLDNPGTPRTLPGSRNLLRSPLRAGRKSFKPELSRPVVPVVEQADLGAQAGEGEEQQESAEGLDPLLQVGA